MARESLRSLVGPASPYPLMSIVDATGVSPADRRREVEERWEERMREESRGVVASFDPGCSSGYYRHEGACPWSALW